MILVLASTPAQETELETLLEDQQDRNSPDYHRWVNASEFAERFGLSVGEVEQLRAWLASAGLRVDRVASGRRWIEFSGTASQVETAFRTKMMYYPLHGKTYLANATDLAVPASVASLTHGVLSLNSFGRRPPGSAPRGTAGIDAQGRKVALAPNLTAAGSTNTFYVAPGDFASIYGTKGLLSSGIDGTGVSIAVTAQSQIELTDVQQFRSIFGLKANDPNILVAGSDPGIASQLDAQEALLDVEWAGAVAPGATINLVVAQSTDTTSGVDLAAAYAIDNEVAPILTYTYGACEQALGSTGNAFYNALWQQAAAEGITVLVASGDNGAAGCDNPNAGTAAQLGFAVNGVASTPYNVAVGGTEFDDVSQTSLYWNASNSSDYSSAIGYIPERAWNESCDQSQPVTSTNCAYGNNNINLLAGSGGMSTVYPKPDWQTGTGVPNDNARDLPDIALASASAHDDFVYCTSLEGSPCQSDSQHQVTGLTLVGGTSAATPAMAGILALLEQRNGLFQGQINYNLYHLAAMPGNSCDSSQQTNPTALDSCVFYDITTGSNSVPCVGGSPDCSSADSGTNGTLVGHFAGSGYDLATGLGSLNATNLANAWTNATRFSSQISLQASTLTVTHGSPIVLSGAVSASDSSTTPTGLVSIKTDFYGDSLQILPLAAAGEYSGTFRNLPGGQYNLLAHYAGDGVFAPSDSPVLPITITPEDSTTTVAVSGLASGGSSYGTSLSVKIVVAGVSAYGVATGSVQIFDNGSPISSASLNPEGVAFISSGGNSAYAFAPGAHSLTATYSGDNSFHASGSEPLPFSIDKGSPFVVVGLNSNSIPVGGTLGAHVIVSGSAAAPATGTIQFTSDGSPCGPPVALQTGGFFGAQAQASALLTGLTPGTHVIGANYSAGTDPHYLSVTSGDPAFELTQMVSVNTNTGSATTTKLTITSIPANLGDTGRFSIAVAPKAATGTATIWDSVGPRSAAALITSGSAVIQFAWTQAGSTSVYAVYSGDATNASSTSTAVSFNVQKGIPQVALSAPVSTSAQQQITVNLRVTGNPANLQLPTPTGVIELWDSLDGGTAQLLASQILTAGGVGIAVSAVRLTVPPGAHTFSARYRGDTNWQARNSANIQLDSSTFTLSVTPTIAVPAGGSGSGMVTITPSGGFTGTVALTCATGTSSLPVGYSCAFAQPNVPVSSGAATTNITLTPTVAAASAIKTASARSVPTGLWFLSIAGAWLLIGFPGFASTRDFRNFARFCGFVLLATVVVNGGGGGGGGGGPVSTSTSLVSSNLKAGFGTPVTFNVTVTPAGAVTPGGTVQLLDNGQPLGGPVRIIAGVASFLSTSLPVGVHTLKAQYSGDANALGSTSAPISQTITGPVIVEVTGSSNGITQTADFTVVIN